MKRLLLAAALAAPPAAWANSVLAPVVAPAPLGGAVAVSGTVGSALAPLGLSLSGGLARALVLPAPLTPPPSRVVGEGGGRYGRGEGPTAARTVAAALRAAARLSGTVEGARRVFDLAAPAARLAGRSPRFELSALAGATGAAGPADEVTAGGSPKTSSQTALKRAAAQSAAARRLSVEEPGRWQRMKASTKDDFRALFASLRTLRGSLVLPRSGEAIRADARAVGRFLSEVRALGWKVIGAVILYYLVRDSILYLLIPYLVIHGVFR